MSSPGVSFPTIRIKWRARTELSPGVSHRKRQARKAPSWAQLAIQDLKDIPGEGVKRLSFFQHFSVLGGFRCKESSCDVDIGIRFSQKFCLGTMSANTRCYNPLPHTCVWALRGRLLPNPRIWALRDREYLSAFPSRVDP